VWNLSGQNEETRDRILAKLDRLFMKCTETDRAREEGYDMAVDYVDIREYIVRGEVSAWKKS
jgi:hypothetical protein